AGGLAVPRARELMNDLVSERAAARHDADFPRLADVPGDDAHLALAGRDEPRAVRADEPGATLVHVRHHAGHVEHGDPLGDADDEDDPGVGRLEDRGGRHRRGDVDDGGVRLGLAHRLRHGVEHGDDALEQLAALSRRHARDHPGAIGDHLLGVERAVAARDPLDDEARGLVDEDAHAAPFALATACFTASSMSVSAGNPACFRISIPSRSLVPVSRITIGTLTGNSRVPCTMPLATSSERVIPPKILNSIAVTLGLAATMRSTLTPFCGLELPPMSRKLAGAPP